MGSWLRKVAILLLVAVGLGSVPGWAASPYKTRNVIIASMDGVRYSETFGEPQRQYIPQMAKLSKEGTLYSNCYNTGITITRQGHSTIATGTWQTIDLGGARQTMPTLWEYARNELGLSAKDCWVIFGKGNYSYAPYSSFPGYGKKYEPSFVINIGENAIADDAKVLAQVFQAMDADKPRTMFLNFGVTDHVAHTNHWENYLEAVRHCDQMLGKLWAKVQSTPGYQDETTFFFTTDHGRHNDKPDQLKDGFAHHGDHCEGCEHVWVMIAGPDIKKGAVIDRRVLQVDIAPTAAELLGVQTPLAEGAVLADCLVDCRGVNKKLAKTPEAQEALRLKKLAQRDLLKTLAEATLLRKPAELKPSPEVEILLRGVLQAAQATKQKTYRQFVESWAKQHVAQGEGDCHVARILVELSASGGPPAYLAAARKCAEKAAAEPAPSCPLACALRAGLLARVAQAAKEPALAEAAKKALGLEGKTEEQLIRDWQKLGVRVPPMACLDPAEPPKGPPASLADALRFVALADLARALPKDRIARLACDLQQSACSRGMPELGGLWPCPIVSALVLYEVAAIRPLRQSEPISQWVVPAPPGPKAKPQAKPQAEGKARPQAEVKAKAKPQAQAKAKPKPKPGPGQGPAWATPEQFYRNSFPYAVDLLRYKVDERGHYADGSPMADGAAMLLFTAPKAAPPAPAKPLPPVSPGCTRVIIEFGWGEMTRWQGTVAVESGKLVALLPYLFEPNDKLDADARTFDCQTMKATDGLVLDIDGTDATKVTVTAKPQGISFTLGELKAKRTMEAKADGGNAIRATLAK